MYSLSLGFKQKTKKITLPKSINSNDLLALIAQSFKLKEKIIGFTNQKGQLITIDTIRNNALAFEKNVLYLITTEDMKEDNMSFASDHVQKRQEKKQKRKNRQFENKNQIPDKLQGFYQGVIGDLQIFQHLFLPQTGVTIVFCFIKQKPKNVQYPYFLYHTSKNSAIVYVGSSRICEFFIENMQSIPKEIDSFIESLGLFKRQAQVSQKASQNAFMKKKSGKQSKSSSLKQEPKQFYNCLQESVQNKEILSDDDDKLQINDHEEEEFDDQDNHQAEVNGDHNHFQEEELNQDEEQQAEQDNEEKQAQTSLLENLLKLRDDQEITELEFYKMKSELLQNLSDFMRKYQMGTRKGLRKQRNLNYIENQSQTKKTKKPQVTKYNGKAHRQDKQDRSERQEIHPQSRVPQSKNVSRSAYSRDQRRSKKYQIPIIVRKYNNVIQKISTSYPLTQEQEQSINLILELQLKGLISQKQSGVYKSSILQQDPQIFPLFLDYFDSLIDQLQLVSKLKKIKNIDSEKKERSQHNMRLLIKYARQGSYELLRNLLIEKNHLVLAALDRFRNDKNVEKLTIRLQKIANVYRQKGELESDVFE